MKLTNVLKGFALSMVFMSTSGAAAAAYPEKTVRIVVPFPPGTVTDLIARQYADQLSKKLGQSFVVENKPGAGGTVGAQYVNNSAPDGYTVLFVSSSHAAAPALNDKLPYDTENDFSGISLLGSTPTLIITKPDAGLATLDELITQGKSRELTYGSAGVGSAAHLACEYFAAAAGIEPLHIPYKGSNEYVAEVRAGRIDFACPPIATPLPLLNAGDLLGVTVMDSERSPLLPDVPTTSEAKLDGVEYGIWYGVLLRKGSPDEALDTLSEAIKEINEEGALVEPLKAQGVSVRYLPPAEFDRFIVDEVKKFQQIVDSAGIMQ